MLMSYLIEKQLSLGMLARHKASLLLVSAELNILDLSKEAVNISQPRCIAMHLRFLLLRETFSAICFNIYCEPYISMCR